MRVIFYCSRTIEAAHGDSVPRGAHALVLPWRRLHGEVPVSVYSYRNGDVCDVCIEIWSKISQIIGLQASNICDCGVGERILSFEPDLGKALDLGKKVGLGM